MLANVLTNEKNWHSLKIRNTRRVFVSVCNKFDTFASHPSPAYEYRPFRKRLLNFSECCECCHSPSILVSIRKPLVTMVRHSEAFATCVRHLQGACNVCRFPFLANVLPLLNLRKQWAQRHIHSVFIPIATSSSNIRIICKKMARQWQRW